MVFSRIAAVLLLAYGFLSPAQADVSDSGIDFNREVRPILSNFCFTCHGPDETKREADMRLDLRESALLEGGGGLPIITPGDPEKSELIKRIRTSNPKNLMPPPSVKHALSDEQKTTLERWIKEGAPYEEHWAFVAPKAKTPPVVENDPFSRTPIDAFVSAKMRMNDLQPSEEADPYSLIRRLYLDLVGFPPTAQEVDRFMADPSPNAYERIVDRLLASPHLGERRARRWMDLARYADTNGYEKDRPRSIWPFRDWVIDAFNSDKPFDEFTTEQLAGDLLPDPTPDQLIATGFHRNTMLNEEGGIDPLDDRFQQMVDRVGTTGTTWLGMTIACAQCHTHKFDPIQHEEYYQIMAFFNNTVEPEFAVPDPLIKKERERIEREITSLEAALPGQYPGGEEAFGRAFRQWYETLREESVTWEVLSPSDWTTNLARLERLQDDSILASGDPTKREIYELTFAELDLAGVTALRLEALPHPSLPRSGPGRSYYEAPTGDFFLSEISAETDNGSPLTFSGATENYGKLAIGAGDSKAALALDGDEVTGWSTSGGEGKAHQAIFYLGSPLETGGELKVRMVFNRHYPASLGRFRLAITRADEAPSASQLPHEVEILLHLGWDQLNESEKGRLRQIFLADTAELEEARKKIESLRREKPALPTTLIFEERPADHTRPTYRYHRGEFLQPKEEVKPGVPAILPDLPEGAPRNRLGFAQWLVDESNPLVSRVTMNRLWASFFGRGIVSTLEDFGYQAALPSHPELLDWLAVEFQREEWSMKRMQRLMVTSATYRQASTVTPEMLEKDPENVWLARSSRYRIDAELVRDSALSMAGLLTEKLGGPSVFPPQPANVTTEGAYGQLAWKVSKGEDRYRRGLYTFSKRTAPYAMFSTFDASSGEACLPMREVTNTPLQALTALNDEVFVEAASELGRRMSAYSAEEGVPILFARILTRPPTGEEGEIIREFFHAQKEQASRNPTEVEALVGPTCEDPAHQAAWILTARALMNLDETFVRP